MATGLSHAYRAAVESWSADAVILTEASNDNIGASRLSDTQVAATRAALASSEPPERLVAQAVVVEGQEETTRTDAYAFGIDLTGGLSPSVVAGRPISDPATEVLIDESLTQEGWALGDTLGLAGTNARWTVVGLTRDLTFQTAPVITVDAQALIDLGDPLSPAVNAMIVPGGGLDDTSRSEVASALAQDDLVMMTPADFIGELPGYSAQVLTFSLMIGALVVIAALVLGIFLYVLTLQKRAVLGVLKARGVPTRYLVVAGGFQTAMLAAAGVILGLVATQLTGWLLPASVPFRPSLALDAVITVAFVVMAVLGGLMSVRVVSRIDPAEAVA
ncbi:ABC transporter permease [Actinomyces howellii]|uniref:ABC transporter permease n=1 Tax=Actinomyces howellii TaxID=52771 RepID=UPI001E5B2F49|nr:ABC transporter permease [Actinomyces howellii]